MWTPAGLRRTSPICLRCESPCRSRRIKSGRNIGLVPTGEGIAMARDDRGSATFIVRDSVLAAILKQGVRSAYPITHDELLTETGATRHLSPDGGTGALAGFLLPAVRRRGGSRKVTLQVAVYYQGGAARDRRIDGSGNNLRNGAHHGSLGLTRRQPAYKLAE